MVKKLALKCVKHDDLKTEYELKGLDEQSTLHALECLINEVVPFNGPFHLKYAASMKNLEDRPTKSLKRAGMTNGTVIVFEPKTEEAGQLKPTEDLPTMDSILRGQSSYRRNSQPFEYDIRLEDEITLEGWEDAKEQESDDESTEVDTDALPIAAPPPLMQRQASWVVLGDNDQISDKEKQMIEECSQTLELNNDDTANLLRMFDWDSNKLFEQYVSDPAKVFEDAGIERDEKSADSKDKDGDKTDQKVCGLCFDADDSDDEDEPPVEFFSLDCGHQYCKDCWTGWLEAKFEEGPECIFTKCMHVDCNEVVPTIFYQKMVDKEKAKKIEQYVANAFVSRSAYIKWCPAKDCGRALEYKKKRNENRQVSMRTQFLLWMRW